MLLILLLVENCLGKYDALHNFSGWLRTGLIQLIIIGIEVILEISLKFVFHSMIIEKNGILIMVVESSPISNSEC